MRQIVVLQLLVLLFLSSGCAVKKSKKNEPVRRKRIASNPHHSEIASLKIIVEKDGWAYGEQLTNPGTRSEGRIGHMMFNKKRVPPCFHSITTPVGTYNFISRRVRWGHHGWEKRSAVTPEFVGYLTSRFKTRDTARGYYVGQGKKLGTPKHWIRVSRGILYYWVDPAKIFKLIADKKFSQFNPYGFHLKKQ